MMSVPVGEKPERYDRVSECIPVGPMAMCLALDHPLLPDYVG